MRIRSVLTLLGAAAASAAGAILLRRHTARRRERLELYFDDGTLVALTQGTAEAEPLLVHARELLAAARG
jgi:hypothetical protein